MDKLKILITGAGAPGIMGTISSIRKSNLNVSLVGVDINEKSIGKYLVDHFEVIPQPESPEFIPSLLRIVEKYSVDIIIPQVTRELSILAKNKLLFKDKNCSILINDANSIEILNNKYLLLEEFKKEGLNLLNYSLVKTKEELKDFCKENNYPKNRIVVKLPVSNGMRGLRIFSEDISKKDLFYGKPGDVFCTLDDFLDYFTDSEFPTLLATEYLPGEEITVDCLAKDGESYIILPRRRDVIRTGISFQATAINEKEIIDQCKRIIKRLNLSHMFGFQFKYSSDGKPVLLESNPRIQGTMVMGAYCNANVISGAIELEKYGKTNFKQSDIIWDSRLTRYWGGVVDFDNNFVGKF